MTQQSRTLEVQLRNAVDRSLAKGLPQDWPADRALAEAGLDSISLLTLIGELEQRFSVRFSDEDLNAENFSTLSGIHRLVSARLDTAD